MGLAPYGTDQYYKDFINAIEFENGNITIDTHYQFNKWPERSNNVYEGRFGAPRQSSGLLRKVDKDIAAATQYALEEALIKIAHQAYDLTKSENLCLAGGVALNSVANKQILDRTPFENIFIQPASGDDGCALGNALLGWISILKKPRQWRMNTAYTGRCYSQAEIQNAINKYLRWCAPVPTVNVLKTTSELLSQKNIIGWFQGGSEFGPRALGHRSILSDARFPEMKDILNKKVKHREGFRPFAPSILEEYCNEYFDLHCPSPYMLLIADVKKPGVIPATTHVDQTARVQTVNQEDNGIYYDLIKEYHKLTGVPVILNTSFNVAGEPIVETPEDAIRCFLCTQIDYLVLGDTLLRKFPVRCALFKVWPQDMKRVGIKKLKQLCNHFPMLSRIKNLLSPWLSRNQNIKVPG
jgi:carbamoyltransferase